MTVNHGVLGSSPCSGAFWEFSSAGSEHLPYKQRVGGSNPSTPTSRREIGEFQSLFLFIDCLKVNFRQSISKNVCSANSSLFEVDGVRIIWAVAGINGYYIFKGIPASASPFESVNSFIARYKLYIATLPKITIKSFAVIKDRSLLCNSLLQKSYTILGTILGIS